MPLTSFDALPPDARVWIFASSDRLDDAQASSLLAAVDAWLMEWRAHGEPLRCARDWREGHFLAVGVDERATGASGCSVDALYRVLQGLERSLGTTLVAGGRIFHRDPTGAVCVTDRLRWAALRRAGEVHDDTPVFDTALTSAATYRESFERPAHESWHAALS